MIDQNVTLFAVLIHIENGEGLLRPGMNVDALFDVARREGVLTLPLMALRASPRHRCDRGDPGRGRRRSYGGQLAVPAETDDRAPARGARRETAGPCSSTKGCGRLSVRDGGQIPTAVETGITDLDRVEITGGLAEGDEVLLLPTQASRKSSGRSRTGRACAAAYRA